MNHPEIHEVEHDENGRPVFVYAPDCQCAVCVEQRHQHDSAKLLDLQRIGDRLQDARAAGRLDRVEYLLTSVAVVFDRWEPVNPVDLQ